MDLGTGRIYNSKEEGLAAGVPESDLFEVQENFNKDMKQMRRDKQPLKFGKSPFASIKNNTELQNR